MRIHGRLYRRPGNPIWQIRFRGPKHGKLQRGDYRMSCHTEDRKKAEKMLADKVREWQNLKHGIPGFIPPSAERITVNQLVDSVIANSKTRRLKGVRQTEVHAKHIRSEFGHRRAVGVSTEAIDAYIGKRRTEKAAEATINRELEILRRGYRLLKLTSRAPDVPKLVGNVREGFWERAQFERFVAELPSELLRDFWRFGYATGMRLGEIKALDWSGYDRETRTLRLHGKASKTGRARVIPIGSWPELSEVVERRLAARRLDSPLVFHSKGHGVGNFYETMGRALLRAELHGLTFHDLRRTAARNMLLAGVPQAVAMKITGHTTDSMFRRYAIVDEAVISAALGKRAAYEATLPTTSTNGPKVMDFPRERASERASER
jgi:integrase